jgi:hypothetical protein
MHVTAAARNARKARIALGFALILLLFLGETFVAHQRLPQAASPVVWALLGGGAVVCLGLAAWFHRASRRR